MPLTISNLPILKKDNKSEYPKWHAYYEKVYKKGVTEDVDLNTFNWFYLKGLRSPNFKTTFSYQSIITNI